MTKASEIRNLMIDEVSLVDKGAGVKARVVIAKRDVEKETTVDEYFDEQGNLVDLDTLAEGDVVFDKSGQPFQYTEEEEPTEAVVEQPEPVLVGKSRSFSDEIRVELSKALTDADRDNVIAKALGRVEAVEKAAQTAIAQAQAERDLRLDREYTEVAKSYNVPVPAAVLGPVLKRLAEVMDIEDQKVIAKCLQATSSSEELFREFGSRGTGDNLDVLTQVNALVETGVSKGAGTRESAFVNVLEEHPEAYEQYLAERTGR